MTSPDERPDAPPRYRGLNDALHRFNTAILGVATLAKIAICCTHLSYEPCKICEAIRDARYQQRTYHDYQSAVLRDIGERTEREFLGEERP